MDEILKRFGADPESVEKLAGDAAKAEAVLGIHGVSVTARDTTAPPAGPPVRLSSRTSGSATRRRGATRSTAR
jgi:hypothetical protein